MVVGEYILAPKSYRSRPTRARLSFPLNLNGGQVDDAGVEYVTIGRCMGIVLGIDVTYKSTISA